MKRIVEIKQWTYVFLVCSESIMSLWPFVSTFDHYFYLENSLSILDFFFVCRESILSPWAFYQLLNIFSFQHFAFYIRLFLFCLWWIDNVTVTFYFNCWSLFFFQQLSFYSRFVFSVCGESIVSRWYLYFHYCALLLFYFNNSLSILECFFFVIDR